MYFLIIRKRLKSLFCRNPTNLILTASILFFLIIPSCIALSNVIRFFQNEQYYNTKNLINALLLGVVFVRLVSSFLPSYQPFKFIIPPYYPIPHFRNAVLHLIYSLICPINAICFLIYVPAFIINREAIFLESAVLFVFVIISISICTDIIRLSLRYGLKKHFILNVLLLTLGGCVITEYYSDTILSEFLSLFCWTIVLIIQYYANFNYIANHFDITMDENNIPSINYANIIFRKKISSISFFVAVLFKTLVMLLLSYVYINKNDKFSEFVFFVPLIASTSIYYTYLYNNFFGFFIQQAIWLGYINGSLNLLKIYARSQIVIILLDCSISCTFLYFVSHEIVNVIVCILSAINCFIIGFIASINAPNKVEKVIDFQRISNTNLGANLITLFSVFAIFYFRNYLYIEMVAEIIIIGIFIQYVKSQFNCPDNTYLKLVSKLSQ